MFKALFQLIAGTWTVTATFGGSSKTATVEIETDTSIDLFVSMIPSFTYTGTYEIVNDRDQKITMSTDNWKIKFLTGGKLKFTELNGAANGIDIFAVGGGDAASSVSARLVYSRRCPCRERRSAGADGCGRCDLPLFAVHATCRYDGASSALGLSQAGEHRPRGLARGADRYRVVFMAV